MEAVGVRWCGVEELGEAVGVCGADDDEAAEAAVFGGDEARDEGGEVWRAAARAADVRMTG